MSELTSSIRIREIRDPAQLSMVETLAWKIFPKTYEELIPAEQIPYMMRRMYDQTVLRREFAEGIKFAVIWDGATPIGYLSWHMADGSDGKAMRLEKLYLDFAYHGRSIGNLALRFVIDAAMRSGASFLSLNVHKRNLRAQRAYRRAGFFRWREEKEPVGNGFFKDDYVMRYDIPRTSHAEGGPE
ncbi:MAG: GNAT family N-acetyltransferase [Lentisphaeria bacterium]|nr:GNAT family N-acetyltransferase [Lentisphaeria bacterium]